MPAEQVFSGIGSPSEQVLSDEQVFSGIGSPSEQVLSDEQVLVTGGKGSPDEQVTNENVDEQPNLSTDFAREVRCRTSTPIEDNPVVVEDDCSHTFDPHATGGGLVTLDTVEIELSVEAESDV